MARKVIHLTEREFRNLINNICENIMCEGMEDKSFKIYKGSIPIMVSAPHTSKHSRENDTLPGEQLTGELAMFLYKNSGCHCIIQDRPSDYDPNYDKGNEYQTKLLKYIKENDIKFLIDLHGCDDDNGFSIDVGTAGVNLKSLLDEILPKHEINGLPITYNKKFEARKNDTITKFISEHNSKCIAIQLEINASLRDPDNKNGFSQIKNFIYGLVENINRKIKSDLK